MKWIQDAKAAMVGDGGGRHAPVPTTESELSNGGEANPLATGKEAAANAAAKGREAAAKAAAVMKDKFTAVDMGGKFAKMKAMVNDAPSALSVQDNFMTSRLLTLCALSNARCAGDRETGSSLSSG